MLGAGEVVGSGPSALASETISFMARGPFPPQRGLLVELHGSLRRGPPCFPGQQVTGLGVAASESAGDPEKVIGLQ